MSTGTQLPVIILPDRRIDEALWAAYWRYDKAAVKKSCFAAGSISRAKMGSPCEVQPMDSTIITAMAGVLGSLVGGSATVATTWVTQRTLSKREMLRAEIRKRETLYGEFISECSARIIDSFERTLEKPGTLLQAYALLNRIRLCASDAVLAQAEATLRSITEQYFSPNLSVEEMRNLVRKWTTDPLEPFGEACRLELKSMRSAV